MPAYRTRNLDGASALNVLDDAIERAFLGGAHILKQRMQELAPLLTGRMERSVEVSPVEKTAEGYRCRTGPTVDYGRYTELEPYIIGKRLGVKSQIKGASMPWMRPAADDTRDEIKDFIVRAVQSTVRGLASRFRAT